MRQVILLLYISLFSVLASARDKYYSGLLVEPLAGYHTLGSMQHNPNYKYEYDGFCLGIRFGLSIKRLIFGLQYERAFFEVVLLQPDYLVLQEDLKVDYDGSYLGGFLGLRITTSLRIWGIYFKTVKFGITDGNNKDDEISGSGYGGGVGWAMFSHVSLNFEYRFFTLKTYNDSGVTARSDYKKSRDVSEMVIFLTFPFIKYSFVRP